MLEVLKFIFQDFWHWLGTVILVVCISIPFCSIELNIGKEKKHKEE